MPVPRIFEVFAEVIVQPRRTIRTVGQVPSVEVAGVFAGGNLVGHIGQAVEQDSPKRILDVPRIIYAMSNWLPYVYGAPTIPLMLPNYVDTAFAQGAGGSSGLGLNAPDGTYLAANIASSFSIPPSTSYYRINADQAYEVLTGQFTLFAYPFGDTKIFTIELANGDPIVFTVTSGASSMVVDPGQGGSTQSVGWTAYNTFRVDWAVVISGTDLTVKWAVNGEIQTPATATLAGADSISAFMVGWDSAAEGQFFPENFIIAEDDHFPMPPAWVRVYSIDNTVPAEEVGAADSFARFTGGNSPSKVLDSTFDGAAISETMEWATGLDGSPPVLDPPTETSAGGINVNGVYQRLETDGDTAVRFTAFEQETTTKRMDSLGNRGLGDWSLTDVDRVVAVRPVVMVWGNTELDEAEVTLQVKGIAGDSTETIIHSSLVPIPVYSTDTYPTGWSCVPFGNETVSPMWETSGGWSNAKFENIAIEIGNSDEISTNPGVMAIHLEVVTFLSGKKAPVRLAGGNDSEELEQDSTFPLVSPNKLAVTMFGAEGIADGTNLGSLGGGSLSPLSFTSQFTITASSERFRPGTGGERSMRMSYIPGFPYTVYGAMSHFTALFVTPTQQCGSFWFNFEAFNSTPDMPSMIATMATDVFNTPYFAVAPDGDRRFMVDTAGGDIVFGPVVTLDEWHHIEWGFDGEGTSFTVKVRYDGADLTDAVSGTLLAASSLTTIYYGWVLATEDSTILYLDDIASTTGVADHPVGDYKVIGLKPRSVIDESPEENSFRRFTGGNLPDRVWDDTFDEDAIVAALRSDDHSATGDGVGQYIVPAGGDSFAEGGMDLTDQYYMRVLFDQYSVEENETVQGVDIVVPYWADFFPGVVASSSELKLSAWDGFEETFVDNFSFGNGESTIGNPNSTGLLSMAPAGTSAPFGSFIFTGYGKWIREKLDNFEIRFGRTVSTEETAAPRPGMWSATMIIAVRVASIPGQVLVRQAIESDISQHVVQIGQAVEEDSAPTLINQVEFKPIATFMAGFELGPDLFTSKMVGYFNDTSPVSPAFAGATVTSTTPHSGNYCMELGATADLAYTSMYNTQQEQNLGFYFYLVDLPAEDVPIVQFASAPVDEATAPRIYFRESDARLVVTTGDGESAVGPVLVADQWYRLDVLSVATFAGISVTSFIIKTRLDGLFIEDVAAVTPVFSDALIFGWHIEPHTATIRYDDIITTPRAADFPLGSHKVVMVGIGSAEEAPAFAGGTVITDAMARFADGGGTLDSTFVEGDIVTALTDNPPLIGDVASDGVYQRTIVAVAFLKMLMDPYALGGRERFLGARPLMLPWTASGGTFGSAAAKIGSDEAPAGQGPINIGVFAPSDNTFTNISPTGDITWPLANSATYTDYGRLTQEHINEMFLLWGDQDSDTNAGLYGAFVELAVQELATMWWVGTAEVTEEALPITAGDGGPPEAGQVTETDIAQPITASLVAPQVEQATETDTAQPMVSVKELEIGQATETDIAQAMTVVVLVAMGQSSETDTAQVMTPAKREQVGQAVEDDSTPADAEVPIGIVYDVRQRVTKSVELQYDVRLMVVVPIELQFDVRQTITKSVGILYDVIQTITKSISILYGVRLSLSGSFSLVYSVRARVSESFSIVFDVRQIMSIAKVFSIRYGIRKIVSRNWTIRYGVRVPIASSKSVAVEYDARLRVQASESIFYDTGIVGNTVVSKSFSVRYHTLVVPSDNTGITVPTLSSELSSQIVTTSF